MTADTGTGSTADAGRPVDLSRLRHEELLAVVQSRLGLLR